MGNSFEFTDHFKTLSSQDVLSIVLTVLRAHYIRAREELDGILIGFDELHQDQLAARWDDIQQKNLPPIQALDYYTRWIASQLDGGAAPLLDRS